MSISYQKTTWVNGQAPAINATNLNKIEQGVKDACDGVDAMVDYVTEEDTSSGWAYRKWNSGKVEAWHYEVSSSYAVSQVGVLYRTTEHSVSMPSGLFTAAPKIFVSPFNDTGMVSINATASSTTQIDWYGWAANSTSRVFKFRVYAVQD